MNLHPIFAHFPVALLTIYAIMELLRFKKLLAQPYWFYLKGAFVMLGGLGALAADATGSQAISYLGHSPTLRPLIRMHSLWAKITIAIFGIVAACYFFEWAERQFRISDKLPALPRKLWNLIIMIARYMLGWPIVILALAGLAAVTVTGGLGGRLAYGPQADPFFDYIYRLFLGS